MKPKVYAFDFDGTLTRKDTFLEFIRFTHGTGRLLLGLLLFSPILLLMACGLYPNWKAKQQLFSWFYKGWDIARFDHQCQQFALLRSRLLRPQGMSQLQQAVSEGSHVIIVSASIDNWVRPFFQDYGQLVTVACTRIDVRHDIISGKFLTMNCYGPEKVKRISRAFPHRNTYHLIAYGDSRGDKEMLDFADEGHYKPFR